MGFKKSHSYHSSFTKEDILSIKSLKIIILLAVILYYEKNPTNFIALHKTILVKGLKVISLFLKRHG